MAARACARGYAVTLDDRKKGNEAAYIAQQEKAKIAAMQAKFESLMAKDNTSEEKAELMEILGARSSRGRAEKEKMMTVIQKKHFPPFSRHWRFTYSFSTPLHIFIF